jgi:hypothetical protein
VPPLLVWCDGVLSPPGISQQYGNEANKDNSHDGA